MNTASEQQPLTDALARSQSQHPSEMHSALSIVQAQCFPTQVESASADIGFTPLRSLRAQGEPLKLKNDRLPPPCTQAFLATWDLLVQRAFRSILKMPTYTRSRQQTLIMVTSTEEQEQTGRPTDSKSLQLNTLRCLGTCLQT